jgi:hypothetical protein
MARKNEEEIQEIISWIKKKSPEPWEILYKISTEYPELLDIQVGALFSIKWGRRERLKSFWSNIWRRRYKVPLEKQGGELLTRLPKKIVRISSKNLNIQAGEFIGKAFGGMPDKEMSAVSFCLLEEQLNYIKGEIPRKYFSINLEAPTGNGSDWQDIKELFLEMGNPSLSIELTERRMFPTFALHDLADICRETGAWISIDDICSGVHDLRNPEAVRYLIKVISILGTYITTFKVDYDVVKDMLTDTDAVAIGRIGYNLSVVAFLWQYYAAGIPMCSVTFESMPREDRQWLLTIQMICILFEEVYWQKDKA